MIYKIRQSKKPTYFHNKFGEGFVRDTRFASKSTIRENIKVRSDLGKSNFSYQATKMWNSLPSNICVLPKLEKFKIEVKSWIRKNIDQ